MLGTEEGIARAFAKLDTIKEDVVGWEVGAQLPQLLADGEVVFSTAWNGRVFNAKNAEGQAFEMVWDGQIYDLDLWVIPKGSKMKLPLISSRSLQPLNNWLRKPRDLTVQPCFFRS